MAADAAAGHDQIAAAFRQRALGRVLDIRHHRRRIVLRLGEGLRRGDEERRDEVQKRAEDAHRQQYDDDERPFQKPLHDRPPALPTLPG